MPPDGREERQVTTSRTEKARETPRAPGSPLEGPRDRERIRTVVLRDHDDVALLVADRIVQVIAQETAAKGRSVLGLATGSTPLGIHHQLIRRHQDGEVDFSHVVTFNLDEYYPMVPDSPNSYRRYMWENLFAHVNIRPENVHIPDGGTPRERLEEHCAAYERAIGEAGGIDFQILGIGKSGHIGFNEPGSPPDSRTRLVMLDTVTRKDAAADFFGEDNVPREAITMGVATILGAREIALIATGEHKAAIVRRAVEGEISRDVAATGAGLFAASRRRRHLDGRDHAQAVGERERDRRRLHDEREHRGFRSRRDAPPRLRGAGGGDAGARRRDRPARARNGRSELRAQGARRRGPRAGPRGQTDDPGVGGDRGARGGGAAAQRRAIPEPAVLPDGRGAQTADRSGGRGDRAGAAQRGAPRSGVRGGRPVGSAWHAPDVQSGDRAGARGGRAASPRSLAVSGRVAGMVHQRRGRPRAPVAGRAPREGARHL